MTAPRGSAVGLASQPEDRSAADEPAVSFGPFRLLTERQLLVRGDKPVRVGSRALAILAALIEEPGETVSKEDLIKRAWPNTFVEEANLRVHIAALRRALGDKHQSARYIVNVAGRGYRFVAPLAGQASRRSAVNEASGAQQLERLPAALNRLIGRAEAVRALAARLERQRLVTIAGPGGIGKTSVALAVAEQCLASYADGAAFVDLAALTDPQQVPVALASVLKLSIQSMRPLAGLLGFLRDKHMLIILDSCERVVDAVAAIAETLLKGAPGVRVLATTSEPLRAEGEWVHRLPALDLPASAAGLTAAGALAFSAIQLFVERAAASRESFALTDADVSPVVDICRRLDGIPLAIEIAAARVDLFGLRELWRRLDNRFQLLTHGRRTAVTRHQTLRSMLDWSHENLLPSEQVLLRRLAVFAGSFTLASAGAVAGDETDAAAVVDGVASLAHKSLIVTDVGRAVVRYRLLDSMRIYAAEQLAAAGEADRLRRRHAGHCVELMARAEADWEAMTRPDWLAAHGAIIDDVRAALDWAFAPGGDPAIGVTLTAAALPLGFQLALIDEFRERVERALGQAQSLSPRALLAEMRLNIGHMHLAQNQKQPEGISGFARATELAERIGIDKHKAEPLIGAAGVALGLGEYHVAVDYAEGASALARAANDDRAILGSNRILAQSTHFLGDHARARPLAEAVRDHPAINIPLAYGALAVDRRVSMRIVLARILWLAGRTNDAVAVAEEGVDRAWRDSPFAVCQALALAACPIALWRGDHDAARAMVATLLDQAARYTLGHWQDWGRLFADVIRLREASRSASRDRHPTPSGTLQADTLATFAEHLASGETIARAAAGKAGWCAPEILRASGELVRRNSSAEASARAETIFRNALDLARSQDALAWELRAATSLAHLWRDEGRAEAARDLLAPVCARFAGQPADADLVSARTVLAEAGAG